MTNEPTTKPEAQSVEDDSLKEIDEEGREEIEEGGCEMSGWREQIRRAQNETIDMVGDEEPQQTIPLKSLRLDGGTQPRAKIYEWAYKNYAEEMEWGKSFPAIVVFFDGNHYWLADGFHRVHAALFLGWKEIRADIRQGTQRDAILFSAGANAAHGLQRSRWDKRRAVARLLRDEEWAQWSDRVIARRCHVGHPLVAEVRQEIEAEQERERKRENLSLTGRSSSEAIERERKFINRYGGESVMVVGKRQVTAAEAQEADRKLEEAQWRSHATLRHIREDFSLPDPNMLFSRHIAEAEAREAEARIQEEEAAPRLPEFQFSESDCVVSEAELVDAFVDLGVRLAAGDLAPDHARRVREICEMILELMDHAKVGKSAA